MSPQNLRWKDLGSREAARILGNPFTETQGLLLTELTRLNDNLEEISSALQGIQDVFASWWAFTNPNKPSISDYFNRPGNAPVHDLKEEPEG